MFKIGLIGCGHVAISNHLEVISQTPGLILHAIYDPDPQRLAYAQQRFQVPHAHDRLDLFFETGLDAVVITSPAPAHKDNILEALRCGLPVLCEKPLVMNREEGEQVLALRKETGLPVYTAFCYRFSSVALAIRDMIAQKAIGEVRSLRLIYNWNLHGKYILDDKGFARIQERRKGRMLEGGPMIDCGTHQIDLSIFWLNSPVTHFSGHGAWVEDYEAPDHMWLHMDHANGAHTTVEISYSYHQVSQTPRSEFIYELIGTDGVIRYDRDQKSFTLDTAEGRRSLPFSAEKNFAGMYQEFHTALIRGSSDLLPDVKHSLNVTDIAMQATLEAIQRQHHETASTELTSSAPQALQVGCAPPWSS